MSSFAACTPFLRFLPVHLKLLKFIILTSINKQVNYI